MRDQSPQISSLTSTVYCILFPKFLVPCLLFAAYCLLVLTAQPTHAQWAATYGGSNDNWCDVVYQTGDGGYIMGGGTVPFGAEDVDVWVLKLDAGGNVQWQKTYGGTVWDDAESIQSSRPRQQFL